MLRGPLPSMRTAALVLGHSPFALALCLAKGSYTSQINDLAQSSIRSFSAKILAMIVSLRHFLGWLVSSFSCRADLVLVNLALRRQLLALHAQRPRRRWTALHKLFWVALRMCWSRWRQPLVLVTPRTVVNWHRAGFRLYWTWVSRISQVGGRKRVSKEVRALIFRMVAENPTWGAPRVHGELLKLGCDLSERSVSRWIRQAPKNPDPVKRWLTFLRNHREAIAAMDFFTVPTLTFGVLYCFFVIGHDRRKILHFNVTRNPHALWVVQQLREAWAYKESVPTENLVWPITAPRRARVTCYTAPLHLVDFKCASSFGEAQDFPVAFEEAYAITRYVISGSTPKIPARFGDPIVSLPPYQFAMDTLNRAESAPPSPGQTREGSQDQRRGAR